MKTTLTIIGALALSGCIGSVNVYPQPSPKTEPAVQTTTDEVSLAVNVDEKPVVGTKEEDFITGITGKKPVIDEVRTAVLSAPLYITERKDIKHGDLFFTYLPNHRRTTKYDSFITILPQDFGLSIDRTQPEAKWVGTIRVSGNLGFIEDTNVAFKVNFQDRTLWGKTIWDEREVGYKQLVIDAKWGKDFGYQENQIRGFVGYTLMRNDEPKDWAVYTNLTGFIGQKGAVGVFSQDGVAGGFIATPK